jgi:ribosomal protein S18 acetylase RimI-like enzyme
LISVPSFAIQRQTPFRYIALDQFGREQGFASRALELHGQPLMPGEQHIEVFVKSEARGAGVGSALLEAIEKAAREDGATSLTCSAATEDQATLAFLNRRGYAFQYEMLDATQDLTRFDPTVWRSAIIEAEGLGFSFTTLLQGQDDPAILQNLYELDRQLSEDVPQWSGVMPPFEQYCAALRECDPEAVIIAWQDGAPVGYIMTTPDGHIEFLGVLRNSRGKRIALILKVLTAEWAIRQGLKTLETNNNAASEAIISLNRKLGYVMRFGRTYLIKRPRNTWKIVKQAATTVISLALFIGGYVWWKDWYYGLGMGAIILVHEYGHMVAGRLRKVPMSWPTFIPFLGAFVSWQRRPPKAYDEAIIAAGGPVAGLLASGLAWGLGSLLDLPQLVSVAYVGFSLHLFNMIPVMPFDGGRITQGVGRWLAYLFVPAFVFYCLWQDRAWLLGALWREARAMLQPPDVAEYHRFPFEQRVWLALTYAGLVGIAALGLWGTGTQGFVIPWFSTERDPFGVTYAASVTGILTAGYIAWRVARARKLV